MRFEVGNGGGKGSQGGEEDERGEMHVISTFGVYVVVRRRNWSVEAG